MKFLRRDGEQFQIKLERGEKALLLHLLSLYPLVPSSYHKLTKDKHLPHRVENQQLLDDALASQRERNQNEILALIGAPERFAEAEGASNITFNRADLEWLLQVVNDVRIGCWLALGSPGYAAKKKIPANQEAMRQAMFLEVAGGFEMFFLGVINGDVPPENAA
jgi:hypothetical protein